MKRITGVLVLAVIAGWSPGVARAGNYMAHVWDQPAESPDGIHWGAHSAPTAVPGALGPWGQPVPMAAPYSANPPTGDAAARSMLSQSMPLDLLQQANFNPNGGAGPGLMQTGGGCPPGGCPPGGPGGPGVPGAGLAPPGVPPVPGLPGAPPFGPPNPPGAVAAVGALTGGPSPFPVQRTEVRFVEPAGMKISWYAPESNGKPGFSTQYLEAPARYNFLQASIYRLKLSDIPRRPGVELYPTLEVVPAKAKTCTFLAHSAVPICFTEEDFDQVAAGNFVVKVIYLPDPQLQDLVASTCPDEVVSSRLEPGVDPICEAQRRGSILAVVRLGNIDLEAPNTPAMDTPSPFCPPAVAAGRGPGLPPGLPPGYPGGAAPNMAGLMNRMVPYGAMGPSPVPPGMPGAPPQGPPSPPPPPNPTLPGGPPPTGAPPVNTPASPQGVPLGQLPPGPGTQPVQYTPPASPTWPGGRPSGWNAQPDPKGSLPQR